MSNTQGSGKPIARGQLLVVAVMTLAAAVLWVMFDDQTKWFRRVQWYAQPALWSWMSVVGMTILGTLAGLLSWRKPRGYGTASELVFWLRATEYLAWFMGYTFVVSMIGYSPATLLFTPLLGIRIGWRSPAQIGICLLFGLAVILIFRTWLGVALPSSVLFEYLPALARNFMLTYF